MISGKYQVTNFTSTRQLTFTVAFESYGRLNLEVYKVLSGVYTLLELDFHYTVSVRVDAFDSELVNVARITLVAPLATGAYLQVRRVTARDTEFLAVEGRAFQTEAFEYMIDRVCLIQQEQEGHLCDCRGDVYPPYVGVPPVSGYF